MNGDREEIERQLEDVTGERLALRLPGTFEQRLSRRDRVMKAAMALDNFKGCPLPARMHAHAAEYSTAAYETKKIGTVPPLSGAVTQTLRYRDPGGAATVTHWEAAANQHTRSLTVGNASTYAKEVVYPAGYSTVESSCMAPPNRKSPTKAAAVDEETRRTLRKVFEAFDADGSGAVSASEMQAMVRKLGLDKTADEVAQLVQEADPECAAARLHCSIHTRAALRYGCGVLDCVCVVACAAICSYCAAKTVTETWL